VNRDMKAQLYFLVVILVVLLTTFLRIGSAT
jgi:hypothetical protein